MSGDPVHLPVVYLVTVPAMAVEGCHLPVVPVPVLKAINVEVVVILPGAIGRGADCRQC